jgi:hypothetical protein
MAIRYCVLLFMFPSPIAVRFGSSQQLIWVIRFSAHRFWGGRERGGGKAVRGKGEREEQKDTHSDNDERTRAALLGFTLYLWWRRVPP